MKIHCLLIEHNISIYSLNKFVFELKKKNLNMIFCLISDTIIELNEFDIILNNNPYDKIIKNINFYYDYIYKIEDINNFDINVILNNENNILNKYFTFKNILNYNLPLISVIITCYNSEKTIDYSLKSIINQTYSNLEILIINDNSDDNTLELINKYLKIDKRIKLFNLKKNMGCYYCKNIGLKNINIKSKYITFHDSDDISLISRIYKQYNFMIKNKLLFSNVLYYDNEYKLPLVSMMFNILIFKKLGYFNINRFGEDEHYYYRYFSLFENDYDFNSSIIYNNEYGFFKKNYKYFMNLNQILYIRYILKNSLTNINKNRLQISTKLKNKYKKIIKLSINKKLSQCYYEFNENISNEFKFNVSQVFISNSLKHLKYRFLKKYNMKEYYSNNLPCLFFGIYNDYEINLINSFESDVYIIWAGTDLNFNYEIRINNFKKINFKNVKINYIISNDLEIIAKQLKLNYLKINLNLIDDNYFNKVIIKKDKILIYNGISKNNEEIYGKHIYNEIINELTEFKFVFSNELNFEYEKVHEIYKECFIGLRLTSNDGNANSVLEFINMNIPIIHNGDYKESLKWKTKEDIIRIIKKNIPKFLIIFNKDLNLNDGSLTWLINFIKLIKSYNPIAYIYIECKYENIKFDEFLIDNTKNYYIYDHIFFRIDNENIIFEKDIYEKLTLILHNFNQKNLNYYNNFSRIICNSKLIKDDLIFENITSIIKVLPPLIDKINLNCKKNNIITFCYSGTIKKSYKTLELLKLFLILNYNFKFILIYGKHKLEDKIYDNELINLIKNLKDNIKFEIYEKIDRNKIYKLLEKSHYGIVLHDSNIDFKQQSTKLIEYCSVNCIPITYLTYLNSNYIDIDLNFKNIDELKLICNKIFINEIKFDKISINIDKLKNHLIDNNNNIFDYKILTYTSNDIIKNCDKILITNNYKNLFLNKKVIFVNKENFINIKNIINYNYDIKIEDNFLVNYKLDKLGNYKIKYKEYLFNFLDDLDFCNINCKIDNNIIEFTNKSSLEIELLFEFGYYYLLEIECDIDCDNNININILNEENKDINRNLYFLNKSNRKENIKINLIKDSLYYIKLSLPKSNKNTVLFKINKLIIHKLYDLNKFVNNIKVINLENKYFNFYNIFKRFESNGILSNRIIGVDGYKKNVLTLYNNYDKESYNDIEKKINRKLIQSPGAYGYLLSMKKIFEECIKKNYEYIFICDDDIGIVDNFIIKFNNLYRNIGNFRLLMFGSSQYKWDNIKYFDKYYIPNEYSNGSFANIYHRSTFDIILNNILNFNSPFDDKCMKSIFKNKNCYVCYPNLIIAQLEESSIRKELNRDYNKFKWIKDNYNFNNYNYNNKLIYYQEKEKKNKLLFLIGIITFNRNDYLIDLLNSIILYNDNNIDYVIIIGNGYIYDLNILDIVKKINFPNNISIYFLNNNQNYIYYQTNIIFKFSNNFNYNFGFILNDDILILKKDWEKLYYNAYLQSNYDHLVFYDSNLKKNSFYKCNNLIESKCEAYNCMGALFTITKNLINKIGYFDEINFPLRGHSHIDYTIRCCRLNFNNINNLYDAKNSNNYIRLNNKNKNSTFFKINKYIRELYKVDIYEEEKRLNILNDINRIYINSEIKIE